MFFTTSKTKDKRPVVRWKTASCTQEFWRREAFEITKLFVQLRSTRGDVALVVGFFASKERKTKLQICVSVSIARSTYPMFNIDEKLLSEWSWLRLKSITYENGLSVCMKDY